MFLSTLEDIKFIERFSTYYVFYIIIYVFNFSYKYYVM